jgi:hypothetical protein
MALGPGRVAGLVIVGIAALLAASGVALLMVQVAQWLDTGRWVEYALAELLHAPLVKALLPVGVVSWLSRPRSLYGLHTGISWFLETVPAWLFLTGVGGPVLWRALGR